MTADPKVSVLLPALNAESTLADAIVSIVHQSHEDWELLVIDDGSSDRSVAIAKQFGDPRIRVLSEGVHRGLSAQLNVGVNAARGAFLARLDADDVAYPTRLEKQVAFLEDRPEVDLLGSAALLFRSDGQVRGVRRSPEEHADICARPWLRMPVIHSSWMGRSGWFRSHPYRLDATRMEDFELLRRTYRNSRFANLSEILLGVREDSILLRTQLIARKELCRYAIECSRRDKDLLALKTIAAQIPRALLDVIAVCSGLGLAILPRSASPTTATELADWNDVWATIHSAQTRYQPERIAYSAGPD